MDITKLRVADTAALHVKGPDGLPLYDGEKPVRIILCGPGSRAYGVIEARQSARAIKRMQDNDGKVTPPSREERIAETAEDLAEVTVAFENLDYPPASDRQGAALFGALYADQSLGFITKQVTKFVQDWANFPSGSPAN